MLPSIGADFAYMVIAAMSLFAGAMPFVTIVESIFARRERLAAAPGPIKMASEAAGANLVRAMSRCSASPARRRRFP